MSYEFRRGGPVTDYKDQVGPGWHSLLDQLDAELREVDPEYRTAQVKEKWGLLRVYIDGTPVQVDVLGVGNFRVESTAALAGWRQLQEIVDKYEQLSAGICENCGKPGEITRASVWRKTACDACCSDRERAYRHNQRDPGPDGSAG